jgi:hypothetical protein
MEVVFCVDLNTGLCSCQGVVLDSRYNYSDQLATRKQQIMTWATAEKAKVDEGAFRNSEYWTLFYRRTIEFRPDLDNYLFFSNEMIKISRIFEEGNITREQFEDKYLQLTAILDEEDRRRSAVLLRYKTRQTYETALFFAYRDSLFREYASNLRRQLTQAGPRFSDRDCAVFGDSIQCTTLSPLFP